MFRQVTLALAFFVAWGAAMAQAEKRALVVGVDRYDYLSAEKQLQKAVNDARAVGKALESVGFSVESSENPDRREFFRLWAKFKSRLEPGDVAAFYFSGHAVELGGANYLVPRDVEPIKAATEEAEVRAARQLHQPQRSARRTPRQALAGEPPDHRRVPGKSLRRREGEKPWRGKGAGADRATRRQFHHVFGGRPAAGPGPLVGRRPRPEFSLHAKPSAPAGPSGPEPHRRGQEGADRRARSGDYGRVRAELRPITTD